MAALILGDCSAPSDPGAAAPPGNAGAKPSRPPGEAVELQRLADALVPLGDPGVLVHVETRDHRPLDVTAGVADLTTKAPVDPASYFRIGSITKMFTATVTLQLVADGRVRFDQSVNEVVPGLLADPRVTIRMLLNHTSNLGELPTGYDSAAAVEHPLRHVDPADGLKAVKGLPQASVPPGTKQEYSNLGYVALGEVISTVSRTATSDVIRQRILDPLALQGTSWPMGPALPDPHPHGYVTTKPTELNQVDFTDFDPSIASSAGALVSTTADLASFLRTLAQGRIVPAEQLNPMLAPFHPNAAFQYGLGAQTIIPSCKTPYVGHYGAIPGFSTFAATTLDGRRQVVLMLTNAPDTTTSLQDAVNLLTDHMMCPPGS